MPRTTKPTTSTPVTENHSLFSANGDLRLQPTESALQLLQTVYSCRITAVKTPWAVGRLAFCTTKYDIVIHARSTREGVYSTYPLESHKPDSSPRVLIPPKNKASIRPESPSSRERNRNIRSRAQLGKRTWHQKSGYSLRSKVETTVSRYKVIFGPAMSARRLAAQRAEARIRCQILNKMTMLGMPNGHMVG